MRKDRRVAGLAVDGAAAQDRVGSVWNRRSVRQRSRRQIRAYRQAGSSSRPSGPAPACLHPAHQRAGHAVAASGTGTWRSGILAPASRAVAFGGRVTGTGQPVARATVCDVAEHRCAVDRLQQLVAATHPRRRSGGKDQDVDGGDACGRVRPAARTVKPSRHPRIRAPSASNSGRSRARRRCAVRRGSRSRTFSPSCTRSAGTKPCATDLPVQWL